MTDLQARAEAAADAVLATYSRAMREAFGPFMRSSMVEAALAALQSEGWRPISEAPRDGTRVLLYQDGDIYAGEYRSHSPFPEDHYWAAYCGQRVQDTPEPTHFMPLPAPPEGEI